jgi:hypothetical protein
MTDRECRALVARLMAEKRKKFEVFFLSTYVRLKVPLDVHGFICILYSYTFLLYMFRVLFAPILRSTNCRVPFVLRKPNMDCPGIEPRLRRCETGK